jgi:alginate O-acetyltransferase complex protein AlgI
MQMILLGVTKKLLVADCMAVLVDPVFARPAVFSGVTVASAVVAYSIQIYADFSGYTDIAIGVAKVIGFDLPENFDMPYIARSITEFWRRWHITLSQWLRDYLYIPLGGNRRGQARMLANLMATMVLGGLWHGASWTFVLWGTLHGVGLVAHKLWTKHKPASLALPRPIGTMLGWLLTYVFVCFGWILFRSPNMATVATIVHKIAGLAPGGIQWFFLPLWLLLPLVAVAHAAGAWHARRASEHAGHATGSDRLPIHVNPGAAMSVIPSSAFAGAFVLTAWLVLLFLFTPLHRSPFIYFQF